MKSLYVKIIIVCTIMFGLFYLFFNKDDYNELCSQIEVLDDSEILFFINGKKLLIDMDDDLEVYNTLQLSTDNTNELLVCNSYDLDITFNNEVINDNKIFEFDLNVISDDEYLDLSIDGIDYKIRTLHEDINFTVEGASDDGFYYFDYNNAAVKTDNEGNVVFYTYSDFIRNFKRNEINGEVYYSFLERSYDYDNIDVDGAAHMRLVLLNEDYIEIDSLSYLMTDNGIHDNHSIENHDYQILDFGHYIVTSYVAMSVDNVPDSLIINDSETVNVAAAVFQEIKNGELVFEFNSTNYPELYKYSTDRNNFGDENYEDYMHLNSVYIDPSDNNYIASLRSMDGVIKINRETGELMWILGGKGDMFGITSKQQFSRQHFATISMNGTLTLYDNGVSSKSSRILEFVLDEDNLEILSFDQFKYEDYYGSIRGSALRIDSDEDIFLSAWGYTQDNNAIITEYNYSSDELVIEFYDNTDGNSKNYRVHKYSK